MRRTGTRETMGAAIAFVIVVFLLCAQAWAQDANSVGIVGADGVTPAKILQDTAAAYQALDTYKSEGTVVSDMESDGRKTSLETKFTILLKKPNLFLITWTQTMPGLSPGMADILAAALGGGATSGAAALPELSGAVWSDGTQPYVYMGFRKSYSRSKSDDMAIASATGVSDGAAFTVPSLFLAVFNDRQSLASEMKGANREADQKVGEEDCFVVSGATAGSKKVTYWVSKSRHLLVKIEKSMESPQEAREMPEMTDAELADALKAMGQEVTEASKKSMRESMKSMHEKVKNIDLKGTFTETHTNISSPDLSPKDFQYMPPEGATLRDEASGPGMGAAERPAPPAPGENPPAVGPAGYVLDRAAFATQLAAAHDDQERLAVLAKRWDQVMFAVAFCNVVEQMPFYSAVAQQRSGFLSTGGWSQRAAGDLREPAEDPNGGAVLVAGDCLANIKIAKGALVYIYGDLGATVQVSGNCEVIVGGNIREGAGIEGDDIVQIFVGGDVAGFVRNRGSSMVWVHGHVTGEIGTGDPSTRLHVMGDFTGTLHPVGEASLVYLDVRGFMPSAAMEKAAAARYTQLEATIGESDQPRGVYPLGGMMASQANWVVHRQREAKEAEK